MAVRFPGTAGALLSRTAAVPSVTSYTQMVWGYAVSVPAATQRCFCGFGAPGAPYVFNEIGPNTNTNRLRLYSGSGTAAWDSTTPFTMTTWYHVALTCAGTGVGQLLGYVNGVLEMTGQSGTVQTGAVVSCGGMPDGDNLVGRIAAFKMWSSVLTAAQIQQEMQSYVPVHTATLALWSPLLTHTDVAEYTGTGTWTVGGTLATEDGPPIAWSTRPPVPAFRVSVATKAPPPYHRPWRTWRRVA